MEIKEYEVQYHEIDFNKKASIVTIIKFFQDMFVYQSEAAGIGFKYLYSNNLTWIMPIYE